MSSKGTAKRAEAVSVARSAEEMKRKKLAIDAVNSLFGIQPNYREPPGNNPALGQRPAPTNSGGRGGGYNDSAGKAWDAAQAEYKRASLEGRGPDTIAEQNRLKREELYDKNKEAVFDFNKSKLDEDFGSSDRELRFALARAGLSGGKVDIDNRDKQNLAYDKGVLQAQTMADNAASDFRGADERTRLDIINQIQSGADSASALASAQRGLEVSADAAKAATRGQGIGNVFSDAGLLYKNNQETQGKIDARSKEYRNTIAAKNRELFGALFPNTNSYSGTTR